VYPELNQETAYKPSLLIILILGRTLTIDTFNSKEKAIFD
ncbi:uncharacterized protein METZ01_LOCUS3658, partial [marine metagenome]